MVSDSASVGHSSKAVMDSVVVNNASRDLAPLARTDARVFLLYSTHEEAKHILQEVRVAASLIHIIVVLLLKECPQST